MSSNSEASERSAGEDVDFTCGQAKKPRTEVYGATAHCAFSSKEENAEEQDNAAAALGAAAKSLERVWLQGDRWARFVLGPRHHTILGALSTAMVNKLRVLRIDYFPGRGDPVFGTAREMRMCLKRADADLFALLAKAFPPGASTSCNLQKLTLHGGFHSARSLIGFLRCARPPLEAFRCRQCLIHGRNFGPVVAALGALPEPKRLVEFETDAYVGGQDPYGLLADALPGLRVLRVPRMFGKAKREAALERLGHLQRKRCNLSRPDHALAGNFVLSKGGSANFFLTSKHHDDGYRGQGLWWDDLENTCECMESWSIGKGVTREMVLEFLDECGISLDQSITESECGSDDDNDESEEESAATYALQLTTSEMDKAGVATVTATNLSGEQLLSRKVCLVNTTLRMLLEDVAFGCRCGYLSLRPVLPNGTAVNMGADGAKPLSSLLGL